MGYSFADYPRVDKWYKKLQSLPDMDENNLGAKALAGAIKANVEGTLF
jgi:hypothetical protein